MDIWVLWDCIYEKVLSVWDSEEKLLLEVLRLKERGNNKENLEWSSSFSWDKFTVNELHNV